MGVGRRASNMSSPSRRWSRICTRARAFRARLQCGTESSRLGDGLLCSLFPIGRSMRSSKPFNQRHLFLAATLCASFAAIPSCGGDDDTSGAGGSGATGGTAGKGGSAGSSGSGGAAGSGGTAGKDGGAGTAGAAGTGGKGGSAGAAVDPPTPFRCPLRKRVRSESATLVDSCEASG